MFWLLMNELQDGDGGVDLGEVYGRWCGANDWFSSFRDTRNRSQWSLPAVLPAISMVDIWLVGVLSRGKYNMQCYENPYL